MVANILKEFPVSVCGRACLILVSLFTHSSFHFGQIVPDGSLPNPSRVRETEERLNIEGGTPVGDNLFHSFDRFSVPPHTHTHFSSPAHIRHIFTRVTGQFPSRIDGHLSVGGSSHFYLINPNGILFGDNARLDVNGSFFATTAHRLLFSDDRHFSAQPHGSDLLSINIPVGLQWFEPSGPIVIRGSGSPFQTPNDFPFSPPSTSSGLQVAPQQTLGFFGGEIFLEGADVRGSGGTLEFTSVERGTLRFQNPSQTPRSPDPRYGNITLRDRTLLSSFPNGGNSIRLRGRQIHLANGSTIAVQTFNANGSDIYLQASDRIVLDGSTPDRHLRTSLLNQTLGPGQGGNFYLDAPQLQILGGATLSAETFASGDGGNLNLNVRDRLEILGFAPFSPDWFSNINTATYATGTAGNIFLNTRNLSISDGGVLAATSLNEGIGGNLNLNVRDRLEIVGVNPFTFLPSAIAVSTLGTGNSGNLTIDTRHLHVLQGAQVSAATLNSGNAGRISIRAREEIAVTGRYRPSSPSSIDSSALTLNEALRELLGVPAVPQGASGNVVLIAPRIRIADSGIISVNNSGEGNGGDLRIQSETLWLSNGGLSASTQSGSGGSITLDIDRWLRLDNHSRIGVTAGGLGNGGNIHLVSPAIVAFENSDITADAMAGNGGNIDIQTGGIFGGEFNERTTANSDITASSELGLSGVVNIAVSTLLPTVELSDLTVAFVDPSQEIIPACVADENTFVVTGRGGLPDTPTDPLQTHTFWEDRRLGAIASPELSQHRPLPNTEPTPTASAPPPIEAQTWQIDSRGRVELVRQSLPPFTGWCP